MADAVGGGKAGGEAGGRPAGHLLAESNGSSWESRGNRAGRPSGSATIEGDSGMNRPSHLVTRQTEAVFGTPVTIIRRQPGSRNEFGEWTPGDATETVNNMAVGPAGLAASRTLSEEGVRIEDIRRFVGAGLAAVNQDADRVREEGVTYRIVRVERRPPYTVIFGTRMDPQP